MSCPCQGRFRSRQRWLLRPWPWPLPSCHRQRNTREGQAQRRRMLRSQCQVQWRRGNACCSLFSNPGLLPYGLHQSLAQVLLGVRNHHDACALRVCEDMMRTIDPGKSPTCLLEFTYQVSATHVYDTHANVVCKSICHDIPRSASRSFRDLPGAPDSTHGRRRWIHPDCGETAARHDFRSSKAARRGCRQMAVMQSFP